MPQASPVYFWEADVVVETVNLELEQDRRTESSWDFERVLTAYLKAFLLKGVMSK